MSTPLETPRSGLHRALSRFVSWLPSRVDSRVRAIAWASFVAEVLIIGTGGAVRLTGSGLGCPTWPTCTADSLVTTPELGIHGMIEFGNRTLTGLVGILALILLLLLWRMRTSRKDLFTLAALVLGGVVVQALVGGGVVLLHLHPNLVGFHYVISVVMVCIAAAFLVRMGQPSGPRVRVVPTWFAGLAHASTAVLAVTIVVGVLTTGAGPHSGDATVGRNGFNAELLEHIHAWPGYILFALTVVLVVGAWRWRGTAPGLARAATLLLVAELVQIAIGLYQARNGLPVLAVGIHMVLAALTAAAMTATILRLKKPVESPDAEVAAA